MQKLYFLVGTRLNSARWSLQLVARAVECAINSVYASLAVQLLILNTSLPLMV